MAGEAEKQKPWERKEPEPQMSTAGGTRHAGTFPAPLLCELRDQNRYDQPGFIQEVYEKPHVIRTGIAPHSYSNRMRFAPIHFLWMQIIGTRYRRILDQTYLSI